MSTLLDSTYITDKLDIDLPLIGVYDAPHDAMMDRVIEPVAHRRTCIFAYFNAWMRGQTLKLTSMNFGCKGSGYWLFGKETRDREELVDFLVGEEGLKCSGELMDDWLDVTPAYRSKHKCLYVGPIKNSMVDYLKSVTFFVNPDQLSALIVAANYHAGPEEGNPVDIPFGSGCMQLLTLVPDNEKPKALVGASDLAMRKYLPNNLLAFTVNVRMFDRLCSIGQDSFLNKPYLKDLIEFRRSTK
ncbi:DUF169 domain-containing protein [Saccharicrinis sp. 156]|uniref:DUF169 domain-containing protein n=1 Tax=Saccharicrinis sp. 156 TaxID=3417574 RepID=UPI003D3536C4